MHSGRMKNKADSLKDITISIPNKKKCRITSSRLHKKKFKKTVSLFPLLLS